MHDLVIRGGTIIDGTGAQRCTGDVAVDGERIAAVGGKLGPARREIDADGLLVTPGFVDIHTHYDGQATWDAFLTPSSWHGVTTVVFGNCGVGFAPVRREAVPYLINLMEGVEDIPGTVLHEGVSFEWESFADYLDALAAMPRAIDVGAQVPHGALRFYVMGDRGADHAARPSADEIERMGSLLEEALPVDEQVVGPVARGELPKPGESTVRREVGGDLARQLEQPRAVQHVRERRRHVRQRQRRVGLVGTGDGKNAHPR